MLEARDRRQRIREDLQARYQCPIVQVSPINPGPVKNSSYALQVQALAEESVQKVLREEGCAVLREEGAREEAGPWSLFVVEGEATRIKRALIRLEESHPLGRLFDLDVIDPNGFPLSRRMLGVGERRCIVCGGAVSACIRTEAHTLEEVWNAATKRLELYGEIPRGPGEVHAATLPERADLLANRIAALCQQALREEVELTPKPGLVDLSDSGAHSDMGVYTFYRSIFAIVPYFGETVRAGWRTRTYPLEKVLARVRPIGIEAERAMFAATGGVNTHKGAIFSMGILCLAIGRIEGAGGSLTVSRLCRVARGVCAGIVQEELERGSGSSPTKGWQAFRKFRVTGARGEAEKGFPRVRFFALPLLRVLLFLFPGRRRQALLTVLLGLMVIVKDTNILGRGGWRGLRWVRLSALRVLLRGGAYTPWGMRFLYSFRKQCKARRLSPGGSADLLALTIFLDALESLSSPTTGQNARFHG
ncbi:MAG: triphosphoribosyl-dephospho-CoA synthase CitG [Spirochaetales bacterium]